MDRPTQPDLARLYDDAVSAGHEIRYASDERLVVYVENRWGCGGILLLIALGIVTAFIVPIILLVLGMLAPGGRVYTYELQPNGKVKRSMKTARR